MRTAILWFTLLPATVMVGQTAAPAPGFSPDPLLGKSTDELQQLMHVQPGIATLQALDLVKINVSGAEALSVRARIASSGTVDIPLAGSIQLSGLTVEQAQREIGTFIREKNLVLTPAVSIEVLETPGKVIAITGQVQKPAIFPSIGSTQLSTTVFPIQNLGQLISAAGGLKDTASGVLVLIRPSLGHSVAIPMSTDPLKQLYGALPLLAGDEVQVSNVGQAYVIGAVGRQGPISLKAYSPTTIAQALASAGGMGFEAADNYAALVRTKDGNRVLYKIKARKILQGKVPDFPLQNDDILYVPTNAGKAAIKAGATGLIVSLASTYIYAHP